ncbi:hypothetical protein RFI_21198 [Reticulomyxa filosa]|uniref:Uncharacterized protein n=1 Tax=Reticulomyxa filosa TaxID=46433 RepID=X6MQL9_RETFI|nr:hypothetical protein RFI_21198 [Reticulomyxa filosa]|eukprot:ETO16159.1 hypothetical protein RFI_21198 [Reticulomyxa filosa]
MMKIQVRMAVSSTNGKTEENSFIEILIRVYQCKEYECNVVKYHRLNGGLIFFRQVLEFLQASARVVLTGLPLQQQQILRDNEQDLSLLQKYFPE